MKVFIPLLALLIVTETLLAQPLSQQSSSEIVVQSARQQIGKTVSYDGSYVVLRYPEGDVPIETGVCTDVVVRAFRAVGLDLQKLVHEDMRQAFGKYPKNWGLKRPDRNIDHRRVPNLQIFFERHGRKLPISRTASSYKAGDLVTWMVGGSLPHIGIVSDRKVAGRPLIIHNIGAGTQEEDFLFEYPITGHYRFLRDS
jgi:uncharacterized protein YijF (DUF1287 family)